MRKIESHKYEFVEKHPKFNLYRIAAKRNFRDVQKGDIGGWIESENNLSHLGNAWVSGDAVVYDGARVSGDAVVFDGTWVYGDVQVSGGAKVCGGHIK